MIDCEVCLHEERRGSVGFRFKKWREYQDHMRDVHHLIVQQSGLGTINDSPKPAESDEL